MEALQRNEEFLKESDLIIYWNEKPEIKDKKFAVVNGVDEESRVDLPKSSKKLPLLLARLAYVFEIYDEELKEIEEFEDFVDVLKATRVKKAIQEHETTLEEVSGLLYLIDEAEKVSFVVGDIDEEEFESLMSFVRMFDSKAGVFGKIPDDYEFYFVE